MSYKDAIRTGKHGLIVSDFKHGLETLFTTLNRIPAAIEKLQTPKDLEDLAQLTRNECCQLARPQQSLSIEEEAIKETALRFVDAEVNKRKLALANQQSIATSAA